MSYAVSLRTREIGVLIGLRGRARKFGPRRVAGGIPPRPESGARRPNGELALRIGTARRTGAAGRRGGRPHGNLAAGHTLRHPSAPGSGSPPRAADAAVAGPRLLPPPG